MRAYENALCEEGSRKDHIVALHEAWLRIRELEDNANPGALALYDMVMRFNRDLIGIDLPQTPMLLSKDRLAYRIGHLEEELHEAQLSAHEEDLPGFVDGLIDLIYVAMGTILEVGVPAGAAFGEVHAANMAKHRGMVAKRPDSGGYDAVKPPGWTPPDLGPYLRATRDEVLALDVERTLPEPRNKRILVIGYARHGKDTVCEMLRDEWGLRFMSSSLFCAERVLFPLMRDKYQYDTAEDCFKDRAAHRVTWFEAIRDFNRPDASTLARAVLEEHDVYCGMRSAEELRACRDAHLFDHVIWVDALDRAVPENWSSCTVEIRMADHVLDNNGTREDLRRNLAHLMEVLRS